MTLVMIPIWCPQRCAAVSSGSQPPPPSSPVPISTVCKSTPYPTFCQTVLPGGNTSANFYDYSRFSVSKSLSAARKFQTAIQTHIRRRSKTLTNLAVRALEDCELLAGLNVDYLTSSLRAVNGTSRTLPGAEAEDVHTLLSAILTNVQTCVDGLRDASATWSVKDGLVTPLANDTRLFSVSLALFTKCWVPNKKKKQIGFQKGRLPLTMSERTKAIFDRVSGRKLLQAPSLNKNLPQQVLVKDIVVVSQDGSGNFTTVTEAVAAAPNNSKSTDGYFLVYVTAGVYEEYVTVGKNKKYLMMIGDGINQTIITGNRSFVDGWTTFNSSTFSVVGEGFVGVNMTFRNTAGAVKHQAVAVRNGADLSAFYLCSFEAYQDTLYTHSLRQFYRDCDVYGTVDFIFGNAAALFQNCNIFPRLPLPGQFNAITAQGRTDPNQNTGISILNCTVAAAADLAGSNGGTETFLGRPWKQYSRTVYVQSYMGSLVNSQGWHDWSGDFALNTSYYGEFNNTGPGSDTMRRVSWTGFGLVNGTDAGNFTVSNFLFGDQWLPQTGVPFFSGLL
ncbi:unnamed protein product [Cuscuta campestris]|uniref:Pectinesterase n=1 Tax=Cuscuta campestris TaxID=132261 RepID=A0A484KX30_9ASTE|nr:unnamed protein product [Cuscuta campestris]